MGLVHVHSWVWAVLPESCRRVAVSGDEDLAGVLRASGLEVVEPQSADAWLHVVQEDAEAALAQSSVPIVATALPLWPRRLPATRAGRVVRRVVAPVSALVTRMRVRALRRAAVQAGRSVRVLATGDRAYRHVLGHGRWAGVRRGQVSAIVVASRGALSPDAVTCTVRAAEAAIGLGPLHPKTAMVAESGKVLQVLQSGTGQHLLLSLGGGPAGELVQQATTSLTQLRASLPPAAVDDLVPWPLWSGRVGPVTASVVPLRPGRAPRHLREGLWQDVVPFLVGLWDTPAPCPPAGSLLVDQLDRSAAALAAAAPDQAGALRELRDWLRDQLDDVRLGWCHGDLWPRNLLVVDDRLGTVVDWDSAVPWGLPCSDVFDLLGGADRQVRSLGPGPRTFGVLWPALARSRWLHEYCERVGVAGEREHLQALAVAYWLDRTSRDLGPFRWNSREPGWVGRNIATPLALLTEARGRSVPVTAGLRGGPA